MVSNWSVNVRTLVCKNFPLHYIISKTKISSRDTFLPFLKNSELCLTPFSCWTVSNNACIIIKKGSFFYEIIPKFRFHIGFGHRWIHLFSIMNVLRQWYERNPNRIKKKFIQFQSWSENNEISKQRAFSTFYRKSFKRKKMKRWTPFYLLKWHHLKKYQI